jgi:hypothetical protein
MQLKPLNIEGIEKVASIDNVHHNLFNLVGKTFLLDGFFYFHCLIPVKN